MTRIEAIAYAESPVLAPFAVRREHEAYGHLLAVRDAATNDAIWQITQTDGAGRILGERFGAGQTTTKRTYFEDKERVRSILTKAGDTTVQRLSYEYDDRLNLTRRTDALQGISEYFEHDKLDRPKCADFDPAPGCAEWYSYGPDGNILHKPGFGPITYDLQHPHAAVSGPGGPFQYDDVGNQIARGGERIVAVIKRQAWGPGSSLYVHVDHLGSVDVITDQTGAVKGKRSYDAFGPPEPSPPPDTSPPPEPSPASDPVLTVWVIGDPPPWRKEPKQEEPSVPAEVGATTVPTDINVWGNTAGHAPQPSPTTSDAPPQEPFSAEDAGIVVAETLGEIALDIARGLVLTFGGYGSYQMGKAMWEGYQEDGLLGALNAVNPLYWIGIGAADTYIAAEKGDYRAATAAGLKTAVVVAATAATAAQGVGALGRAASAAGGAGARARQIHGAVGEATRRRTTIAVTETAEGTRVVTSSEPVLRPAQQAMLRPGEVAGAGPGHAEVTGVEASLPAHRGRRRKHVA